MEITLKFFKQTWILHFISLGLQMQQCCVAFCHDKYRGSLSHLLTILLSNLLSCLLSSLFYSSLSCLLSSLISVPWESKVGCMCDGGYFFGPILELCVRQRGTTQGICNVEEFAFLVADCEAVLL